MGVAEKLYELAKALPEDQASELLDFAEFCCKSDRANSLQRLTGLQIISA